MSHNFANCSGSVRLDYLIALNAEHSTRAHCFAAQNLSLNISLSHPRSFALCPPILSYTGCENSMAIRTVIVDDERPARDELQFLLRSFPEIEVIAQGKNGLEALALIKEHNPDLVFLDVQMPGLDGFGVIQRLMDRKVRLPHIVFATAYESYAVQAFEVNAVDYILKPFDKQRLARAVQRAHRILGAEDLAAERLGSLV